ncbi:MAG: 3-hydroxyacyl-ACP dehydratase FabZ family protein [Planctomycetaceae bacterium]
MPPQAIYDLDAIDFDHPIYTIADIREVNPQRFEMEQLTAIVHVDCENHGIVGYKRLTFDEFWCAGHMPGYPLMPGVLQCEAAAQLASFYTRKFGLLGGSFVGFGGLDDVRFRSPVFPGSRLDLTARAVRVKAGRLAEFEFQGLVDGTLVFSGKMTGVAIHAAMAASV